MPAESRRPWWPALLGAVLMAAGLAWFLQAPTASKTDIPGRAESTLPPPGTGTTAQATPGEWRPGAPRRVRIPALGVSAPVEPVTAPNDTLVPPADPTRLGWWSDGARPGDELGSALVAGHTVNGGGGALNRLEQLEAGDVVTVTTSRGRIDYVVQRTQVFRKGALAREAQRLFSQEVPGRLVLVTCEDWDGTRYLSNVVVTAVPE
ncbi:class F sortase [Nocardioides sp. GCM10027113]|uniref:class F sortase n=1 Tax=unclassified Nocardioides TaxID=2615069 RepID=UPI00360B46B9